MSNKVTCRCGQIFEVPFYIADVPINWECAECFDSVYQNRMARRKSDFEVLLDSVKVCGTCGHSMVIRGNFYVSPGSRRAVAHCNGCLKQKTKGYNDTATQKKRIKRLEAKREAGQNLTARDLRFV